MSLVSMYYVLFIGIFLPLLSVRSYYKLKAGARFPSKPAIHVQTLVMHGILLLLALLTARSIGIARFLLSWPALEWKDVGLGLGTLVVFVSVMYPQWKSRVESKGAKAYRQMPQTNAEMPWWAAVSLSAGVVEEIVYRGVLFAILMHWIGNWWAAAALGAVVFSVSHAIQGLKSAVIIFGISFVMQALVLVTDSLYVAMAVHATYDFIAGLAYLRFWKQIEARGVADAPAT